MKTPKPILERRRSARLVKQLPFKIGHEGYELEAVTVNISSRGVLCLVDKEMPLMTQVRLALSLPTKDIRAKGAVVRREPDFTSGKFYTAIYFTAIKPRDEKLLRAFIDRRLKS